MNFLSAVSSSGGWVSLHGAGGGERIELARRGSPKAKKSKKVNVSSYSVYMPGVCLLLYISTLEALLLHKKSCVYLHSRSIPNQVAKLQSIKTRYRFVPGI